MLIRNTNQIPAKSVEIDGVKDVSMRLLVGRDDGAPNFAMRHFTVEPGGHTPRHSHNYEHEVYIVAGAGRVEHDGEFGDISAGDIVFVEPNKVHQFVNEGDVPLQFLCLVPVEYDCGSGQHAPTPGS